MSSVNRARFVTARPTDLELALGHPIAVLVVGKGTSLISEVMMTRVISLLLYVYIVGLHHMYHRFLI